MSRGLPLRPDTLIDIDEGIQFTEYPSPSVQGQGCSAQLKALPRNAANKNQEHRPLV